MHLKQCLITCLVYNESGKAINNSDYYCNVCWGLNLILLEVWGSDSSYTIGSSARRFISIPVDLAFIVQ